MAAIFFSIEPISETGYWLGVCHGYFICKSCMYLELIEARELQNEKLLPNVGFKSGPFAYEVNATPLSYEY